MKTFGLLFQCFSYFMVVMGLREKDQKCRYQVHLPQASWHTAYDICLQKNMTLVRVEVPAEEYVLAEVLEEVDNMMNNFSIKSNYSDVWIAGIMRTSDNESMNLDCKSFKPRHQIMPKTELEDKMACLYFNLTDKKLYVDNCQRNKTFVCQSKKQAPENCTMVTKTDRLKDDSVYALSMDIRNLGNSTDLPACASKCMQNKNCYTIKWNSKTLQCISIRYLFGKESIVQNMTDIIHKSYFVFSKNPYPTSEAKPLSDWCPEMTQEIIQEKVDAIQTNLTIDRKNTTKYKRTLISAPDDRISARNVGLVGVVVIFLVVFVIVSFDFINCFQISRNKRPGVKED